MTRREFRLISGQGAGPSVEDITRRKPTRRHFKTLQVGGGGETTTTIRTVTIKGIAVTSSDGPTLLASARLPDGDVTITDENQVISLGSLEFEFNNSAAY